MARRHKRTVHQRGGRFPGTMKRGMKRHGSRRKKVNQKGGFLLTLASILTPIIAGAAFEAVKANK